MLHLLSLGLLASAIAIAPLPTKAQDGTAEDPGDVMSMIQGMGDQLEGTDMKTWQKNVS